MLRTVLDETRLTNNSLCGIDTEFCYPITRPWDVVMYMKPDLTDITNVGFQVFNKYGVMVLDIFWPELYNYFAFAKAYDSNGEIYFIMRQIAPMPTDCYRFKIIMGDGLVPGTILYYYSDMVCVVDSFAVKKYAIETPVNNTDNIEIDYTCDEGTPVLNATYNTLPVGFWFDYSGPEVVLYVPENCVLDDVTLGGAPVVFSYTEETIGTGNCNDYVQLIGNGTFDYDCKGRFYTDDFELTPADPTLFDYYFGLNYLPHYIDDYVINLLCSRVKALANKMTPQRITGSCYIPRTEYMTKYRLDSNAFKVPAWFVEEVNIIAATQAVTLTGVADDNNVLIPLVQSDDYGWREAQGNSQMFLPALVFETCVCFTDFSC